MEVPSDAEITKLVEEKFKPLVKSGNIVELDGWLYEAANLIKDEVGHLIGVYGMFYYEGGVGDPPEFTQEYVDSVKNYVREMLAVTKPVADKLQNRILFISSAKVYFKFAGLDMVSFFELNT